ncbi:MAG: hypothetical protein AAF690_27225 [Acidobacteriota bacterium]
MTSQTETVVAADALNVRLKELYVRVDVDGEHHAGLGRDDFELRIDGRPVRILGVSDQSSSEATPRGQVVVVLDRHFTETAFADRAREKCVELLLEGFLEGDLLSVVQYTEARGFEVLVPFSTDRRQVLRALASGETVEPPPAEDPLGLVVGAEPAPAREVTSRAVAARSPRQARGGPWQPDAMEVASARRFIERAEVFARRFESVPGQKHWMLLSRGLDERLLFGVRDLEQSGRSFDGPLDRTRDTATAQGIQQLQGLTERLIEELVRSNVAVHGVDLGSVDSNSATGTGFLRWLARDTGGSLALRSAMRDALEGVERTSSSSYVLAFDPPFGRGTEVKDRYTVDVSLKNKVRGAKLWYARQLVERPEKVDPLRSAAAVLGAAAGVGSPLEVKALPSVRSGGEKRAVPFLLEIPGRELLTGAESNVLAVEILGYAVDAAGEIHDHFAQTLELDLRAVGERLRRSGLLYLATFEIEDGEGYAGRLLVRTPQGRELVAVLPLPGGASVQGPRLVHAVGDSWVPAAGRGARPVVDSFRTPDSTKPASATVRLTSEESFAVQVVDAELERRWTASFLDRQGALQPLALEALPNEHGVLLGGSLSVPEGRYRLIVQGESESAPPVALETVVLVTNP